MSRGENAKSVSKINFVNNCEEHESIVGWAYQPNNETEKFSIVGTMQGFSLRGRELERGVDSSFYNCENTPLSRISNAHNNSQRTATCHEFTPSARYPDSLHSVRRKSVLPFAEGATHVAHCNNLRKVAFTLAEVLITLGIIGVVAALTLPTIVNKAQSMILKNQFKKAYSTLHNAINLVQKDEPVACWYWDKPHYSTLECTKRNEYGTCIGWASTLSDGSPIPDDYSGRYNDCNTFYSDLRKTLKIVKYCEKNALKNGCVTDDFRGVDKAKQNLSPDSEQDPDQHFSDSKVKNRYSAFLTPDGVLYIHWAESYSPYFAIDINGHKGPNKWGYDLYKFVLIGNKSDGITNIRSEAAVVEKGGKTIIEMINTP